MNRKLARSSAPAVSVALVLLTALVIGCDTRSASSTSTSTTQPVGSPLLFGWDGVDSRVMMTDVFATSTRAPFYAVDQTTWTFTGSVWSAASSSAALPSLKGMQGNLVYDSDHRRELLIAIPTQGTAPLNGLVWAWDGKAWQRLTTSHKLPAYASQFVSAAYSPDLHAAVLIDASTMPGVNGTTWVFDGTDWRSLVTAHWPIGSAYLNYDPTSHSIVALANDYSTWRFDGSDWSQVPLGGSLTPRASSGMGRQSPAVSFDPQRGEWVIFGGFDGAYNFADTWVGNEETWASAPTSFAPSGRASIPGRTFMTWDPARRKMLLFGGSARSSQRETDFGDTWSWDGSAWTQLAGPTYSAAPSPGALPSTAPASAPRVTTPFPLIPPSKSLLFAVVESPAQSQPDTVAIVGMDGFAKAKAKFQPRTSVYIPDAAVPLQGVAQVVGNGVYYIDGSGVVRRLQLGGQPQVVASFTQPTSQYETWFAVSPNGSQLMAGVLTYPAIGPVVSPAPWPTLVGPWKFDLETSPAGGQATVLLHEEQNNYPDLPGSPWKPIFPVGWTSVGAIGMVPVTIGTQNAWFGGPLFLLDATGKQVRQVGGADCDATTISRSGLIACVSSQQIGSVRDSDGGLVWTTQLTTFNALSYYLSPDGQAVAQDNQVETRTAGVIALPTDFHVEGWLDNNTVVGRTGDPTQGDLSWISIADPLKVTDFGFKGDFVGTVGQ